MNKRKLKKPVEASPQSRNYQVYDYKTKPYTVHTYDGIILPVKKDKV